MSNVYQLYQLQQLDSRFDAANRRLKEIAANLVETAALKNARAVMDAAAASFAKNRASVANLDLDVKGLQQKIAKNEKRLYGGKISNPKEATSLQEDITATKRWLGKREEELLEAMIVQEEAEATLTDKRQAFSAAKTQWETEQADLLAEKQSLEAEAAMVTIARDKLASHVERDDLRRYMALQKQKGGVAVTGVQDGICLMCGVVLSHRLLQKAYDDSTLCYCEGCGRILYTL